MAPPKGNTGVVVALVITFFVLAVLGAAVAWFYLRR